MGLQVKRSARALLGAVGLVVAVVGLMPSSASAALPQWHLIDRPDMKIPSTNWLDQWKNIEGGTLAQVSRRAGFCDGVPQTYATTRLHHAGFSTSGDIRWDVSPIEEPWLVQYYYSTYLGRQVDDCDYLKFWSDHEKNTRQSLTDIACSDEAMARRGRLGQAIPVSCRVRSDLNGSGSSTRLGVRIDRNDWNKVNDAVKSVGFNCQTDTSLAIAAFNLKVPLPHGPAYIDDIKVGFGRVAGGGPGGRDYTKGKWVKTRKIMTIDNFDQALYVYASKNKSTAAITAAQAQICAKGGPFLTDYTAWLLAAESDTVFREFGDVTANKPIGTNRLGQVCGQFKNWWQAYDAAALVPKPPPAQKGYTTPFGAVYENPVRGWACKKGSQCWTFIHQVTQQCKPST